MEVSREGIGPAAEIARLVHAGPRFQFPPKTALGWEDNQNATGMVSKSESRARRCPSPVLPELWLHCKREHYRQTMQRRRTCGQPDEQEQVLRALWFAAYKIVRHLPPPFPFNLLPYCLDVFKKLPPHRLDLLQDLLVEHYLFRNKYRQNPMIAQRINITTAKPARQTSESHENIPPIP